MYIKTGKVGLCFVYISAGFINATEDATSFRVAGLTSIFVGN